MFVKILRECIVDWKKYKPWQEVEVKTFISIAMKKIEKKEVKEEVKEEKKVKKTKKKGSKK